VSSGIARLALATLLGAIIGSVVVYATSAFVSSRSVRKMFGVAMVALITAFGAPLIWGACLKYGLSVANGPQGMLLAAIPSALLVGSLAIVVEYPRLMASAACVGQAVASLLFAYMVGLGMDGHSDLAARFSILPFFEPVALIAAASLLGGFIRAGQNRGKEHTRR
jgi:hypothetical protein